jgi:excisionase family DNA binding protein
MDEMQKPDPALGQPVLRQAALQDVMLRAATARTGSPFLTTAQAAAYIGLSKRTLEKMRGHGRGPFYRRHGRFVRYHIDDLDAWSQDHSHGV